MTLSMVLLIVDYGGVRAVYQSHMKSVRVNFPEGYFMYVEFRLREKGNRGVRSAPPFGDEKLIKNHWDYVGGGGPPPLPPPLF